ncbi:Mitochondrial ribosomal protein S19 [Taphrina deformans PYCC 5710]|uniref:Small ribosomal subunit protein uS19m n=1 Tax=Taphrina deformans (strain PYCC 5710 / ATCC 11124 / CBS 356.35 / IMI 108563 / JCM 9778 / NBRC 8474) TaxID=1097556 RepID=R4X9Y9_TAPDE|nr:Mitochondrial ribosomal protein S19 [Taphrina deformans PYCC 5710]|eukprot:CCG81064.1 Mitochondrial ribosomal protein S19 [Taphrina deformans PYCC 5710]
MKPSTVLFKRSVWKGPYIVSFPTSLAEALKKRTPIRTQARSCTIIPSFVGLRFMVHNGKNYLPVEVTDEMVGHKLGEFSSTRVKFSYKQTKNK